MRTWTVQDAKAKFSEMLNICLEEGPQQVTRRGHEEAVLVPISQWRDMSKGPKVSLKELLLTDFARGEMNIPSRRRQQRRTPPKF